MEFGRVLFRSTQVTSLCPSNAGARVSAAWATASGDGCAAAGMETRARAARPASGKGFVMERDLKERDAEIDPKFQPSARPQRHTLMTSRKDAKKIAALSSLFASSREIPQAPAAQSNLTLTSTRPSIAP